MRGLVLCVVLMACADRDAPQTGFDPPDAGVSDAYDYFGEPCSGPEDTELVSRCRGNLGVCVAEVCRPACAHEYPACPSGAGRTAPSGLCYCVP